MKNILIIILIPLVHFCKNDSLNSKKEAIKTMEQQANEVAILANGCFWCTEAIFQQLKGVEKVEPGYIGGDVDNPTYEQVCTGTTHHTEALRIEFDNRLLSYDDLLEVYFATHDPTTLNRQGADVGTQYRSEIFYLDEKQKASAEKAIKQLNDENVFGKPVVTKISATTKFWVAENYHHDYFKNNPNQPYCAAVINPKVQKFMKTFSDKIK